MGSFSRALRAGTSPHSWKGPETPLRGSIQAGHVEMIRCLLEAKANPNERDDKEVSVLHISSFEGHIDLTKSLLEARADPNATDQFGQSPIFFAPLKSVCEVLLAHKADLNIINQKGQSALHLAGRAGLQDVMTWLVMHMKVEVQGRRDAHGATASYYARHAGVNPDFLRQLQPKSRKTREDTTRSTRKRVQGVPRSWSAGAYQSRRPLPTVLEVELTPEIDEQGLDENFVGQNATSFISEKVNVQETLRRASARLSEVEVEVDCDLGGDFEPCVRTEYTTEEMCSNAESSNDASQLVTCAGDPAHEDSIQDDSDTDSETVEASDHTPMLNQPEACEVQSQVHQESERRSIFELFLGSTTESF